jgi:SAM-dependent methyltransferase
MVDRYFADSELAALYESFSPPATRQDFAFYAPMALAADAVLDVGCGAGSFLAAVRDAGHAGRLTGLDPGAGMMAQARRRTDIEWVLGDLGGVAWRSDFDLAIMTGHAFQVLLTDDEVREALAAIRVALTADGIFAFETRNPAAREWERWKPHRQAEIVGPGGETVRLSREVVVPFDGRSVTFTHTFASPAWDGPQTSTSTLRFMDAETLNALLAEAGFAVEAQFGDWDRSPLAATSPEIITLARPA